MLQSDNYNQRSLSMNSSRNGGLTSAATPDLSTPTFSSDFKDYRLGRLLGRGAFGSVYEVELLGRGGTSHNTNSNTTRYAIKIIEKNSIKNEQMALRVKNEVQLHQNLRHPNILTLHHYFEDGNRVYLLMELCGRGELYSILRERRTSNGIGCCSEGEARGIMRDVVAGVKFLHSKNIIHRDLKLSNVLISSRGGQAKIGDFGLAVQTGQDETDIQLNGQYFNDNADYEERTICGTPNYLAPEVLQRQRYGKSADIWSLGCLLYSLLVGRPPFDSKNLKETFDRVRRLDYSVPEGISPAARDLIQRLLNADPMQRPGFDQIIWHPFFNPAVTLPLNTNRLGPLRQTTKYGSIEIDGEGRVVIDFLEEMDVVIVAKDGLSLTLKDKHDGIVKGTFPLAGIPNALRRRYEYGRRFVNLLKSKTPLVVISAAGRFKAYLMENSAIPGTFNQPGLVVNTIGDFHLHFYDCPLKLDYCWVSRQLRFVDPRQNLTVLTLVDPDYGSLEGLRESGMRRALLEFLARYKQALRIRDQLVYADGSSGRGRTFPIIIREDYHQDKDKEKTSYLGNMTNLSTFSMTSGPMNSILVPPSTRNVLSTAGTTISSTTTVSPPSPLTSPPSLPKSQKFLPSIGWSLQLPHPHPTETFLVLFLDGTWIQVDGPNNTVTFESADGFKLTRVIDGRLPDVVKDQLARFSRFL